MRKITESNLRETIEDAVDLLENANDRHNTNGDYVKVVINEEGDLGAVIQQLNWWTPGDIEVIRFEYSRPEYDTEQELLDKCGFEGTIEEWDWDNFSNSNDYSDFVDQLMGTAFENSGEDFEITKDN